MIEFRPLQLEEKVQAFITDGTAATDGTGNSAAFEALALEVFDHQYQSVPLYRRFCQSRELGPHNVGGWRQIPALPADAFKRDIFPSGPHLFLSSGTTGQQPSRHELASLATCKLSALTQFRRMVLPDGPGPMAVLVLGPTATSHPNSSLGWMFSWCAQEFGDSRETFQPDLASALAWLVERADSSSQPILLLGISSAFTALFDEMKKQRLRLRLPADSRLVDTGGRKGPAHVFSPSGMLKACWSFLHIPAYMAVNEYGMTEMLSQFYDDALAARVGGGLRPRSKVGPHWLAHTIVDPATLEPVKDGQTGILKIFDLANWETVSALQTLDLCVAIGRGFKLKGRAETGQSRGCSQLMGTIEDLGQAT